MIDINQELVDQIVAVAAATPVGLDEPKPVKLIAPNITMLALSLISAYDSKYDLVAIMEGTIRVLLAKTLTTANESA